MTGSRRARHGASGSRHGGSSGRGAAVAVGSTALLLAAAVFGGGLLVGRATAPGLADGAATVPVASTGSPSSRPTMLARVTRIVTGDEVVVSVDGIETTVRILGIDTPDPATAECGSDEALAFAQRRLVGETVTLVPDPTLPEFDDQGRRLSYVVLRTQLSYTDAVLMDGIGRADTSRPLWYAEIFAEEQTRAAEDDVGIWGAPCDERP